MEQDRYELLNDRVDHVDGRVDDVDARVERLEGKQEAKKDRKLEWIVIGLIILEIAEGFFMYHHG